MSRMATSEYIGAKRRAYAQADRAKRSRILDEVCETTGYGRKYANRRQVHLAAEPDGKEAIFARARQWI